MSKNQKPKTDSDTKVVPRRHKKKTAQKRQEARPIDDRDPAWQATQARNKLDACWKELEAKATLPNDKGASMPTKSRVVLLGNMKAITEGKPIRIPVGMPKCDEEDIMTSLKWFQYRFTTWTTAAQAVKDTYGRSA